MSLSRTRPLMTQQQTASKSVIRHILLDIEGTTTSISFVHENLFPYAAKHLDAYLDQHFDEGAVQEAVDSIRQQAADDLKTGSSDLNAVQVPSEPKNAVLRAVIENVQEAMKRDRKITGLKMLQGLIWEDGYRSGELKSQMYEDVITAFQRWTTYPKYIYSSGSIPAQKLLFGYTADGDLNKYLDGYFDTSSGPKIDKKSYLNISNSINARPNEILFLTDNVKEAKASIEAGLQCLICERPGNAPLTKGDREIAPVIQSFDQVDSYLS